MTSVLVLMIILGCDDSETLCRHLKTIDRGYQTVAACTDASGQEIMKFSGVDYPVVVARCQTSQQLDIATADTSGKGNAPSKPVVDHRAGETASRPSSAASTVVAWTEAAAASAWNHVPGTAEVRTFIGTQGERVWTAFASRVPWRQSQDDVGSGSGGASGKAAEH